MYEQCKGYWRFVICFSGSVLIGLVAVPAWAHVKWFAPYDIYTEPRAIAQLLTPEFGWLALASVCAVILTVCLDYYCVSLGRRIDFLRQQWIRQWPLDWQHRVIRYALGVFFICIWTKGQIILTPELTHDSYLVSTVHLVLIACLFHRETSAYSGVCIVFLWLYSGLYYGFFHVFDYLIFVGLAVFLMLGSHQSARVREAGLLIMYIGVSATLLWASIEKWAYPEWSFPLLSQYPHIAFGLSPERFMLLAGFAEFTLAFFLIALCGALFVVMTLLLDLVFVLAIIDFGKLDAIGHLAIIVALLLMALNGPVWLNRRLMSLHANQAVNAGLLALLYSVLVILFFGAYYGGHWLWLSSL